MEQVPVWEPLGNQTALARINKTNGRLFWNPVVHQYLGNPKMVSLEFDDELDWIGIILGNDYAVVQDEDGNFYIESKSALEDYGLVFPLANNMDFVPDPPRDSHNRVILVME
jgi:hypothetical protein